MKKRELTCGIAEGRAGVHVFPPSLDSLSAMPDFVRSSIHNEPSFRSTTECSSKMLSAARVCPRCMKVTPRSLVTYTLAPTSSPRSFRCSVRVPSPGFCAQTETGNNQSPFLSAVGLFIMMPSQRRRGADQPGCSSLELLVVIAQTPERPSHLWLDCAQNSHIRPCGSCHSVAS